MLQWLKRYLPWCREWGEFDPVVKLGHEAIDRMAEHYKTHGHFPKYLRLPKFDACLMDFFNKSYPSMIVLCIGPVDCTDDIATWR